MYTYVSQEDHEEVRGALPEDTEITSDNAEDAVLIILYYQVAKGYLDDILRYSGHLNSETVKALRRLIKSGLVKEQENGQLPIFSITELGKERVRA